MPTDHVFVPSTSHRLWARAIDGIVLSLFLWPAVGTTALIPDARETVQASWALVAYLLLVPLAYEALAVWLFGTTAGKWVYGLRVVAAADSRVSPGGWESLLRAFANKFSLLFGHAVQALMFFRYDRTHFADWVAGTRVIGAAPRPRQVRKRVIVGLLLVLVLGSMGWSSARLFLQEMSWDRHGLTAGFGWPLLLLNRF